MPALFLCLFSGVFFGYNFCNEYGCREGKTMSQEEQKTQTQSKARNGGTFISDLPADQRRELASKGGKNSVKAKAHKRAAKDVLLDILHSESTNKQLADVLKNKGIEGTELATLLMSMTQKASKSAQMAELVFKLTGDLQEQPQQQITIVNQLSDEQLLQERQKILGGQDMIDVTPRPPELE
jgi:hypothetical protein